MNDSPAEKDWRDLTDAERSEVDRLSVQGQRHPDPKVAAAAETRAREILREWDALRAERGGKVGYTLLAALDFGLSKGEYPMALRDRAERKWARRVLNAQ